MELTTTVPETTTTAPAMEGSPVLEQALDEPRSAGISSPQEMNERSFNSTESAGTALSKKSTASTATETIKKTAKRPRAKKLDQEHRARILEAAERLFSTQGFHGTGMREIAEKAGVSLGNAYNHFETKEALFRALMEDLEKRYLDPNEPLTKALLEVDFPENIERLGHASSEMVAKWANYIRLIYVDVIEFRGAHIARMYGGMKERYEAVFADRFKAKKHKGVLGEGDPVIGAMMVTILYMYYFTVEHLFGVKHHYGLSDEQVIREFAKIFRTGLLRR
jgi:AcrR family transcriptional regulator